MTLVSSGMTVSKQNDEWVSDNEAPDPTGIRPVGWRIVVRPVAIREKTKGGIIIPGKLKDDLAYLTTVGKVLAIGPLAYTRDDLLEPVVDAEGFITGHKVRPWCKVGDYVTYGKYAGAKRVFRGVKILLINDDEVIDVVDTPDDIDPNFNLSSASA